VFFDQSDLTYKLNLIASHYGCEICNYAQRRYPSLHIVRVESGMGGGVLGWAMARYVGWISLLDNSGQSRVHLGTADDANVVLHYGTIDCWGSLGCSCLMPRPCAPRDSNSSSSLHPCDHHNQLLEEQRDA
jgi:hypothetical protein